MQDTFSQVFKDKTGIILLFNFLFFFLSAVLVSLLNYSLISVILAAFVFFVCQFAVFKVLKPDKNEFKQRISENKLILLFLLLALARTLMTLMHCCTRAGVVQGFNYYKLSMILSVLLIYSIASFGTLAVNRLFSFEKTFAIQASVFGIILAMLFPIYGIADEPAHFRTAYSLSNILMGIGNPEKGIYMREDDAAFTMNYPEYTIDDFNSYLDALSEPVKNTKLIEIYDDAEKERTLEYTQRPRVLETELYQYTASALGITFGRLLNLNSIWIYLCGRIFNLLFYVVVISFCLNILPFGKSILYTVGLFPMMLQLAGSPSRDAFRIICAILSFSSTMYVFYGDAENKPKYIYAVMVISSLLLLPLRTFIYSTIAILPLLIHAYRKEWITPKRICIFLAAVIVLAGGYIFTKTFIIKEDIVTVPPAGLVYTESLRYTFQHFINQPILLVKLIQNTFWAQTGWYFTTMIGSSLGWLDQSYPGILVLFLEVILILNIASRDYETIEIPLVLRISLFCLCLLSSAAIVAGMGIRWTPLDSNVAAGVQGRYFLPLALPLFLSFRNKHYKLNDMDQSVGTAQFAVLVFILEFLILRFF